MRRLLLRQASNPECPLPIPAEPVERQADLKAWLGTLADARKHRWEAAAPKAIRVAAIAPSPPFPAVRALLSFLVGDPAGAAENVRRALGLRDVVVAEAPVPRTDDTVVLDAEEFARLHTALTTGTVRRGVFLTVHVRGRTACCIHAPLGATLADVFHAVPAIRGALRSIPHVQVRRLLTGEALDPAATRVDRSVSMLAVLPSGRTLAPAGGLLFPFPAFNRRVREARADVAEARTEAPCTNCLACAAYCPARLSPSFLYHLAKRGSLDDAVKLRLDDCTGCGVCSAVCPSAIPLTDGLELALAGAR